MKDEFVILTHQRVSTEIVPAGKGGTQVVTVSRKVYEKIEDHLQPYTFQCKLLADRGIDNLYCRRSVLGANL